VLAALMARGAVKVAKVMAIKYPIYTHYNALKSPFKRPINAQ
jgi:hypothetical protein